MNISTVMPANNETYGAWVKNGEDEDVHVYLSSLFGVVLGHNKNYVGMKFTPLAISLKSDGVSLQYEDEKGNPQIKEIDTKYFFDKFLKFLEQIKTDNV